MAIGDVGATAEAVGEVAVAATPVIEQQVSQAYENAYKSRVDSIQSAEAALVAAPNDPDARAAFDALFTRLCSDCGIVRPPRVAGSPGFDIGVADLAIALNALALVVKLTEQLAAAEAK